MTRRIPASTWPLYVALCTADCASAAAPDAGASDRADSVAAMSGAGARPSAATEASGAGPHAGERTSAVGGAAATGASGTTAASPTATGAAAQSGDGGSSGTVSTAAGGGAGRASPSGGLSVPALAFPGAQGFGKRATGGRNGSVYHVTQLGDSGPGSFRDAVSAPNRFVVFDVGGYIQLTTAVPVKSNITIAGQTAPGGGIGLRGGELSFASQSNIIMRHMRVRPGSETASTDDDALSLYRAQNVMIDHSSFEFGPWNNIDGVSDDWQNHPVTDITIQDSLIADPTGQQFGAHTESVSGQWAWYRNIFANSHNRNPLAKLDTVFVNNLLYNDSAGYTTHTSTNFKHDVVNNYFVFGPASTGTDNTWYQIDKNQSIYYAGNLKDTNLNGTLDGAATTPYWYQGTGTVLMEPWSTETLERNELHPAPPLDATSAARTAISLAGAWPRDPVDSLIISQVLTLGKGTQGLGAGSTGPDGALYTSQAQTGLDNNGYGAITPGTQPRPTDTDNDGMSDAWELATGSDPNTDDAMLKATDGYTQLEHYVNWLAGWHATSTAGAGVDVDLSAYTPGFSPVSPRFSATGAQNGSVTVGGDQHTAHFQPSPGFHGVASFDLTVSGADGSAYTGQVLVLVGP